MPRVIVRLPGRTCPIDIATGNLPTLATRLIRLRRSPRGLLVVDARAWRLHGVTVRSALGPLARRFPVAVVPPGEGSKSLRRLEAIYSALHRHQVSRDGILVAFGGGVVGDLAGLAAATWQRGIDLVMVPTTLLSQVDSAVGGKTAINFDGVKNVIGAFHQPRFVLSDLSLLATLPRRQIRSALAEVVKYGVVADRGLFARLEREPRRLLDGDPTWLAPIVARCCRIKAGVVSRDERETGERTVLNFGHTLGHALEGSAGGRLLHGEAVALGMRGAARLSVDLGWMTQGDCTRLESLLDRFGLPRVGRGVRIEQALANLKRDKKVRGQSPRFVLTRGIGSVSVAPPIQASRVRAILADLVEA